VVKVSEKVAESRFAMPMTSASGNFYRLENKLNGILAVADVGQHVALVVESRHAGHVIAIGQFESMVKVGDGHNRLGGDHSIHVVDP
jgi:hypothetical protein